MDVKTIIANDFNWVGHTDIWPAKDETWPRSRNNLFKKYQQWGNAIAYQLFATYKVEGMESDDYIHFSSIGLLESLDRYDPTFGVSFKNFARVRLRGEIINNIVKFSERAQSSSMRNKLIKERVASLQATYANQSESGEALVETILDLAIGFLIEEQPEEEQVISIAGTGYDSLEINALQDRIFACFDKLSDTQKEVMNAHYKESKNFKSIATELGLTAGRISQIHTQSLNILRKIISW
jgi:RNA polymerase sigma factor for flagellar operon FliA